MGFSVNNIKAFNKAGARVLQKITRMPLEENVFVMDDKTFSIGKKLFHGITPPKKASTASFVQGERAFGKEGFEIVSFFDDSGKLIQRHRLSTTSTRTKPHLGSITYYQQYRERSSNIDDIFITQTQSFYDGKLKSDEWTALALVYTKPTGTIGTKVTCTLNKGSDVVFDNIGRNMDITATKHLADRFDVKLETVGRHIPKKFYEQKTLYNPSIGTFSRIYGKGKNLTSKELQVLNSDRYLPLRIHKGINTYEYLMKDACFNQSIPLNTPLNYVQIKNRLPSASTDGRVLNIEYLQNIPKGARIEEAVDCLNHECRHIYQHRMVTNLEKDKITDPVLRHKAETYKYEFDNYFGDYVTDKARYRNQLIEKEAFEVGEKATREQYNIRRKIQEIFPNLSINVLG